MIFTTKFNFFPNSDLPARKHTESVGYTSSGNEEKEK
jgi:hypothetical protein